MIAKICVTLIFAALLYCLTVPAVAQQSPPEKKTPADNAVSGGKANLQGEKAIPLRTQRELETKPPSVEKSVPMQLKVEKKPPIIYTPSKKMDESNNTTGKNHDKTKAKAKVAEKSKAEKVMQSKPEEKPPVVGK